MCPEFYLAKAIVFLVLSGTQSPQNVSVSISLWNFHIEVHTLLFPLPHSLENSSSTHIP